MFEKNGNWKTNRNPKASNTLLIRSLGPILSGNDVILSSATGTGKTLAYLIPIIEVLTNKDKYDIHKNSESNNKGAIILAPTKELCAQAYVDARLLTEGLNLKLCRTGSLTHISPLVNFLVSKFMNCIY